MEQLELLNSDKDETIRRHDVIVAGMTRSVTSLEASLAASRDLLADRDRALAAKIKELESKAEQCERTERQLDASARELRRTRASLVRAEESASEKERALSERSRRAVELEADNEDLRTRAASLSSRLEETRVQLTGARSDRKQLQGELEQLRAELRTSHALAATRRSCERGGRRGSDVQGQLNGDHVSTVSPAQLSVVNAAAKLFDVQVKHEKSSLRGGDVSPALLTRRPITDRQRHSPPDDRQVTPCIFVAPSRCAQRIGRIKAKFHYAILVVDGSEAVADLLARASSLLASWIVRDRPNSSSLQVSNQVCDQDSVMEFGLDQLRTGLPPGSSYLEMLR